MLAYTQIPPRHMLQMKDKKFGGVCKHARKLKGTPCDDKELICINVDKVYDWIVKENSFDIFPTAPISFPGVTPTTNLASATVTCEVTPAPTNPIVIQNRENRPFCIDGKTVLLQQLNIQKNFVLTVFVTLANGTVLTSAPETSFSL